MVAECRGCCLDLQVLCVKAKRWDTITIRMEWPGQPYGGSRAMGWDANTSLCSLGSRVCPLARTVGYTERWNKTLNALFFMVL